jgi:hypothetical protein
MALGGAGDWCLVQASSAAPAGTAAAGTSSTEAAQIVGEPGIFSEEWFKKTKEPVPWFKWGGDLRIRDEYYKNARTYSTPPGWAGSPNVTLNTQAPNNETNWGRYRTRLWATVTPVKDVDLNARLIWEFRNYTAPEYGDLRDTDPCEAVWDNLNVKYKNAFGLPVTATIGRQDISLGDGWLVMDGTPSDGSRTMFFDAARATIELKDANTTVDTIYIQQYAYGSKWIQPFNDSDVLLMEQNERGAILYVTNKSFDKTEISPYFIYKQDSRAGGVSNSYAPADIYTYGVRVAQELDDHWRYRAEIAQQLGHKAYKDICAMGFNSQLSYFVKDKLNNNFRVFFEYLSGDRESTKGTDEGWDPLWGRWTRYSELMATIGFERRRPAEYTNYYRVGTGWSFNPTKKMDVATDYHLLFAPQNNQPTANSFSESGHFRGQLITFLMKYTFNKHIVGQIINEYFFPGDYYSQPRHDTAIFLRGELVFTW